MGVEIDEAKLKYFIDRVKVWDYACLSLQDYQRLSVENRSSILKNYYLEMCSKYSNGSGILPFIFLPVFLDLFLAGIFSVTNRFCCLLCHQKCQPSYFD